LACDSEEVFLAESPAVDVFVVDVVNGMSALTLCDTIRAAGYVADRAFDGRSMKSQMKSADRCGARLAVIVGANEAEAGTCTVRNLSTSEQTVVQQSDLIQHLALVLGERQPRRNTQ